MVFFLLISSSFFFFLLLLYTLTLVLCLVLSGEALSKRLTVLLEKALGLELSYEGSFKETKQNKKQNKNKSCFLRTNDVFCLLSLFLLLPFLGDLCHPQICEMLWFAIKTCFLHFTWFHGPRSAQFAILFALHLAPFVLFVTATGSSLIQTLSLCVCVCVCLCTHVTAQIIAAQLDWLHSLPNLEHALQMQVLCLALFWI
jgi:hypothetical protein